jgi:hypothetical protein
MANDDSDQRDRSSWLGLTADGSKLVAVSSQGQAIHVWNLDAIGRAIHELGLGETWPAELRH